MIKPEVIKGREGGPSVYRYPSRPLEGGWLAKAKEGARNEGRLLTRKQLEELKTGHPELRWEEDVLPLKAPLGEKVPVVFGWALSPEERERFPRKEPYPPSPEYQFVECRFCDGWVSQDWDQLGNCYFITPRTHDQVIICGVCQNRLAQETGIYID